MFAPLEDHPHAPGHGVEIVKAVVIATLSAAAAGLVHWGIEELKEVRRRRREEPPE